MFLTIDILLTIDGVAYFSRDLDRPAEYDRVVCFCENTISTGRGYNRYCIITHNNEGYFALFHNVSNCFKIKLNNFVIDESQIIYMSSSLTGTVLNYQSCIYLSMLDGTINIINIEKKSGKIKIKYETIGKLIGETILCTSIPQCSIEFYRKHHISFKMYVILQDRTILLKEKNGTTHKIKSSEIPISYFVDSDEFYDVVSNLLLPIYIYNRKDNDIISYRSINACCGSTLPPGAARNPGNISGIMVLSNTNTLKIMIEKRNDDFDLMDGIKIKNVDQYSNLSAHSVDGSMIFSIIIIDTNRIVSSYSYNIVNGQVMKKITVLDIDPSYVKFSYCYCNQQQINSTFKRLKRAITNK